MKFTKMHGLGNDFVLIDNLENKIPEEDYAQMAISLCDRHYGIGGDGLVFILPSHNADYKMRIFNSNGSEAEMCGNGIRCFARYIYEKFYNKKDVISVETLAGIVVPTIIASNGKFIGVEVDMGEPRLSRNEIPMIGEDSETVIDEKVTIDGKTYEGTAVSMGNPHFVIFVDNIDDINLAEVGPLFENYYLFPEKTNTEFIQIVNRNELIMRVWERGAGETLACGTGACASLVAGVLTGKTERKAIVRLMGGNLSIEWQKEDNHIIMTGPAQTVFEGELHEEALVWK
ncbi:MAG: diaminopimelate epimerase [Candidatus Margulisiibacteriota bacterium]|nr:MAG: diaminopimelate epimerase [Candidatus Margulisbacteria bacterium GWD2_39_127]OGI03923.1 MAG: diaminopimelate epimerase [Candidatus Margulisbacteria bacterium GWF2_38_17]OGI08193.1 MAG: diaminopimelate epimerase [Candidatus Margulisbacteria bacterium GWE2_39_32]PZM78605.1 MAG: diaminopimelate epimerase [Candidatus Margulisiibacteriota bacterium]HAR61944.1 diaminopimelate epimerase [Candidatus Margulisiibacteriota bacterium]